MLSECHDEMDRRFVLKGWDLVDSFEAEPICVCVLVPTFLVGKLDACVFGDPGVELAILYSFRQSKPNVPGLRGLEGGIDVAEFYVDAMVTLRLPGETDHPLGRCLKAQMTYTIEGLRMDLDALYASFLETAGKCSKIVNAYPPAAKVFFSEKRFIESV
jgi:hypothetical protein